MSQNFYLQSAETSTTSFSETNHDPHNDSARKSASPVRHSGYDDDESSYDSDDDNPLPFPAAPERADFLTPAFEPSDYLSTLASNRYQTLEDLRTELRSRSQLLNQELIDLVNSHHDDFTGLGKSLEGGDERVEEVRVGVLGFRREVEDIRRKVAEREAVVERLVGERRRLRDDIELGRRLLDFEGRVALLETRLGVAAAATAENSANDDGNENDVQSYSSENDIDDDDDAEDEDNTDEPASFSLSRVSRRVQDLKSIEHMANRIGENHPFIEAQQQRTTRLRETLLLDLGALLKQLKQPGGDNADQQLKVLNLYSEIDASKSAVEVLKDSK